jgi:hypothetical protein
MSASTSVQRAHDELLAAKPHGASHDACPLCHPGAGDTEKAKEGASVADPKYTEEQHIAILTDAVQRETASLSSVKDELEARVEVLDTEKAAAVTANVELQSKIDVLEAEKAAETQRADAAITELSEFKSELETAELIEKAKSERVAAIKAADESLDDEYFSEERVQRWAEMADDQFTSLVADLTEAAAKRPPMAKKDDGDDDDKKKTMPWMKEKARETAAFSEGAAPTAGSGSVLSSFLTATGKMPATAAKS